MNAKPGSANLRMSSRNSNSKTLKLIFGALVLFLLVWTAYWFWAANWLSSQVDAKISQQADEGILIQYQEKRVTGWPYRFLVTLNGVEAVAGPARGDYQAYLPNVRLHALAWKLSHIIVEAEGEVALRFADGSDYKLTHQRARASMVFDGGRLSRSSFEMSTVRAWQPGTNIFAQADLLEAHLRPGVTPDQKQVFIKSSKPVWPGMVFKELDEIKANLRIGGWRTLRGSKDGRQSAMRFRDGAGHIEIESASLQTGTAALEISGSLHLDERGFLAGLVRSKFEEPGLLLEALDHGHLGQNEQRALALLRPLVGNSKTAELDFKLKKGGVYVGPFRLASTRSFIAP